MHQSRTSLRIALVAAIVVGSVLAFAVFPGGFAGVTALNLTR